MANDFRNTLLLDGLPIYDATAPIILRVISTDIRSQVRKDPENCAIAKACVRELECERARVHLSRTYVKFKDRDHWLRYVTSGAARTEMVATDKGGSFAEGSYTLLPIYHKPKRQNKYSSRSSTRGGYTYQKSPHEMVGVRVKSPVLGGRSTIKDEE
jgi:hypothetical protein